MKKTNLLKSMLLLCALVVGSNAWADVFEKITSTAGLVAGNKYIIVCEGQSTAMGDNVENNSKPYHAYVSSITASEGIITTSNTSIAILTLGGETDSWTFRSSLSNNYLNLTKADNYLGESSGDTDNTTKWTVSFDGDGDAVIQNVAYPVKGGSKSDKNNPRYIQYNKSSGSERYGCYAGTQQDIQLYKLTKVSGTITSCGWSTFASSNNLDLSTLTATHGATAYYASAAGGSKVTLTPTGNVAVPAGEGLMIKGTNGETFTIDVAASGTAISGNLLKGQTTTGNVAASTAGTYHYVFGYESSSVYGFYNLATATEVAAGKAYLETTSSVGARALSIVFDDEETTGINTVQGSQFRVNEYFDLQGRKVAQPTKGLYIVNGKKVVIK